jgi:hypothetical protein
LGFDQRCVRGKAEVLIAPMRSVVAAVEVVILDTDHDPQLHNIGSAPLLAPIDSQANIFALAEIQGGPSILSQPWSLAHLRKIWETALRSSPQVHLE